MASIRVYVHKRMDDTLAVSFVPLRGRSMPGAWGDLAVLGACEVASDALSDWVRSSLNDEGYCAVAGRDAEVVRKAFAGMEDDDSVPVTPAPASSTTQRIWVG